MPVTWTKAWSSIDDGTLLKGADLGNIQTDIATLIQNAVQIHGVSIDAPVAGDDGKALFYDDSGARFDYKAFLDLTFLLLHHLLNTLSFLLEYCSNPNTLTCLLTS